MYVLCLFSLFLATITDLIRTQDYPIEFNIWVLFRHMVDIILLNDFVSYSLFAFAWFRVPPNHSFVFHVLRWVVGWALVFFNLWVKIDAHRIVTDLAWYWADCFFVSLQSLVFDGVFEMAPHPMYSIGYAYVIVSPHFHFHVTVAHHHVFSGYYGLTLVVGSQTVFFVSLAAHACQFFFLVWFENPHIERTYGQKKPIAARVPLRDSPMSTSTSPSPVGERKLSVSSASVTSISEPETERDEVSESQIEERVGRSKSRRADSILSLPFESRERKTVTQHDLNNRYFRHDLIIFSNFDGLRYALSPSTISVLLSGFNS
jgi:phosphatidylethanolamine N-methyltransferase